MHDGIAFTVHPVLSAMEVDPTNLDDIIFPKVVKVSEETGSAQSTISAALLAERGSQGTL